MSRRLLTRSVQGLALALSFTCASPAVADESSEAWAKLSWTHLDGLPQDSVTDLAGDPSGNLWVCTFGGLARFDGQRFVVHDVSNHEGFGGNRFTNVLALDDGSLLLINEEDGLLRLRDGRFEVLYDRSALRHVRQGIEGEVFVSTPEFLGRLEGRDLVPVLEGSSLTFHVARDGAIWRSTLARPLVRYDGDEEIDYVRDRGLAISPILSVCETRDGSTWFGGRGGLWRTFGDDHDRIERVAPELEGINAVVESIRGGLWGAGEFGIVHYDPTSGRQRGTTEDSFSTIHEDPRGNLWAGGAGKTRGLHQFVPTPLSVIDPRPRSGPNDVWSASSAGDAVLAACTESILELRDGDRRRLPLSGGSFRAVLRARDGTYWTSTLDALMCLSMDGVQRLVDDGVHTEGVRVIFEGRDGDLWFGGEAGLARLEGDRFVPRAEGVLEQVHCVLEGPRGELWVGSVRGLSRLEGDEVTTLTREDGLSPGTVRALHRDDDGVLWVGTYGGGLTRIVGDRTTRISSDDGLSDNFISAIVEDGEGRFWINSNKGPFVVHRAELNRFADGETAQVACVLFGPEEGAVEASGGYQPSFAVNADERIYFPNVNGLTVVDPGVLAPTEAPPELSISSFMLDEARRMHAEFSALGYSSPRRVRVQYRTIGSDDDWVECDGRFEARYSYLPPGDYEFQLRGRNGFGPWSPVRSHAFHVPARFYESPWFLLAVVLLIGAGAFRFSSARIRTARDRAARFEQLHNEAQSARRALDRSRADLRRLSRNLLLARDSDRRTISSELHDDITQRIAAIAMRIGLVQRRLDSDGDAARESLQEVASAAQQLARDVQQLSRRLHPVGLRLLGMTDAVRQECEAFERRTGIAVELHDDVVSHEVPEEVEIAAVQIVQEGLHNVEKHARASRVEVDLRDDAGGLLLRVRDDGTGFDVVAHDSAGLGLISMRERAAAIGGRLELESRQGAGTTLTFRSTAGGSEA